MRKILLLAFIFLLKIGNAQTELVDFESNPINVSIDSLTGCWQIGTPSKTIFDTAYSADHALMTDTINPYPDDSISYAYFTFPTNILSTGFILSFYHRYDTEANTDGGYLEILDCGSGNWENIVTGSSSACAYGVNYSMNGPTDNLFNTETGFAGSSTGWIYTSIDFSCMLLFGESQERGGMPNTQFRFVFVSDGNSTSDEGWMIDNILWTDLGGQCSGINELENQLGLTAFPSLTDGEITFETENKLFSKITIYDFSGKIVENFSFPPSNFKTLELSKLSNGMYFYSVEDGKAVGKFMMEK